MPSEEFGFLSHVFPSNAEDEWRKMRSAGARGVSRGSTAKVFRATRKNATFGCGFWGTSTAPDGVVWRGSGACGSALPLVCASDMTHHTHNGRDSAYSHKGRFKAVLPFGGTNTPAGMRKRPQGALFGFLGLLELNLHGRLVAHGIGFVDCHLVDVVPFVIEEVPA